VAENAPSHGGVTVEPRPQVAIANYTWLHFEMESTWETVCFSKT